MSTIVTAVSSKLSTMTKVAWGILGIVVILLCALYGSWYTVNQGDRAVILRFGNIIAVSDPGLHFKMPFFDSVIDFTVRTQKIGYNKVPVYSKDAQPIDINISLNYSVDPSMVDKIYSRYGVGYRDSIIYPQILSVPKIIFGTYTATDIINKRGELTKEILELFNNNFSNMGMTVSSVQIEDIDFSDEYERSIEARMRAEVEVQEAIQKSKRETEMAKIKNTQADAEAYRIRADANAKADAIKAVGTAEANVIEAKSAAMARNPQYVEMIKAEKWNGSLPSTMVPGSAVPFIGIK